MKMCSNLRQLVTSGGHKWLRVCKRYVSTVDNVLGSVEPSMSCWQLNSYSKQFTETTLTLNTNVAKPVIQKPTELLVKVLASSVNPIDIAMSAGYGNRLLSVLKMSNDFGVDAITYDRLPLVLGRDFCGQVVATGQAVGAYRVGDTVWGALPPFARNGSHSQFIVADQSHLSLKPCNLSAIESASIPYVGLTSWAAIHTIGGLNESNSLNKKALVLGGSGGVGTFAIQLLKSWGAQVTTTCAADAIDFVYENTGADHCVDYNTNELMARLESFDFVLNAATAGQHRDQTPGFGAKYCRKWKNAKYVTLSTPLLANTDRYGLLVGTGLSALKAIEQTVGSVRDGKSIRWAFYWPNSSALKAIKKLVESNRIKAVIDKRFDSLDELPLAYRHVVEGHARGKTVIDFT